MSRIEFGTDGWRAIIADDYTVENVRRVSEGAGRWMLSNNFDGVVIGHDCRFGGELFAATAARTFAGLGIRVFLADKFVSTPMVSLGVQKLNANLGVVITASHNPPSYNGFKLKSRLGGPSFPQEIEEVQDLVPERPDVQLKTIEQYEEEGLVKSVDLEGLYYDHVMTNFDFAAIEAVGSRIGYDAMYGAGQAIMRRLFPGAACLHCDLNPGFHGQAPEPLDKNLQELAGLLKREKGLNIGIAHDGDADRIGMFDEAGNFVDSHHILLLLIYYLHVHKGLSGSVVISFSVSNKVEKLARHFRLPVQITRIGFKYIARIMAEEDVLVGGEESGGIAVKGHIPERDGVWIALVVLEMMAKTGKTLSELVKTIYDIVGEFYFERNDLHIADSEKARILEMLGNDSYRKFGAFEIREIEKIDGYKFHFDHENWVMIRPSGTEPVLRVYGHGRTKEETRSILDATIKTLT